MATDQDCLVQSNWYARVKLENGHHLRPADPRLGLRVGRFAGFIARSMISGF